MSRLPKQHDQCDTQTENTSNVVIACGFVSQTHNVISFLSRCCNERCFFFALGETASRLVLRFIFYLACKLNHHSIPFRKTTNLTIEPVKKSVVITSRFLRSLWCHCDNTIASHAFIFYALAMRIAFVF